MRGMVGMRRPVRIVAALPCTVACKHSLRRSAYIAVDHGLVRTILRDGYKATLRRNVPHSPTPQLAAKAFLQHYPRQKAVVLLINGGEPPNTNFLAPHVLKQANPCSGCGGVCYGKIQNSVVPLCKGLSDKQNNKAREKRLNSNKKILYHQTSDASAKIILSAPMQTLLRGQSGLVDAGIYFATSPNDTMHKAQQKGVVLKCEVRLGHVRTIDKSQDNTRTQMTFRSLFDRGYDSIKISGRSGIEHVVYSWDQVKIRASFNKH
jgi:hypothetical protein